MNKKAGKSWQETKSHTFIFSGTDCGLTRCMEASHGTSMGALGDGCVCRCRRDTPAFREDRQVCVNHVDGNEETISKVCLHV